MAGIGATVLVDDGLSVGKRQDAGGGLAVLRHDADADGFAETVDEIPEPRQRLQREQVAPSREPEQMIELPE